MRHEAASLDKGEFGANCVVIGRIRRNDGAGFEPQGSVIKDMVDNKWHSAPRSLRVLDRVKACTLELLNHCLPRSTVKIPTEQCRSPAFPQFEFDTIPLGVMVIARGINHEKCLQVRVDKPQPSARQLGVRADQQTMGWLSH
jgi:hypothetical protein